MSLLRHVQSTSTAGDQVLTQYHCQLYITNTPAGVQRCSQATASIPAGKRQAVCSWQAVVEPRPLPVQPEGVVAGGGMAV